MEHPGHFLNSIETAFNRLAGCILPSEILRWGWVLVHAAIVCVTGLFLLLSTGGTAFCVADCIRSYLSEPVYTATPDAVNPEHEGKLVKLCGSVTTDTMTCDPLTGVQAKTPLLIRTTTLTPDQDFYGLSYSAQEEIGEQLRRNSIGMELAEAAILASRQLGAFRISHFPRNSINPYMATPVPARELTFTQPAPGFRVRPLSPESSHILLTTENDEDICFFQYHTQEPTFYIIARQYGNMLDMHDPDASMKTYESILWSNRRRAISRMMEDQEMSGVLLFSLTGYIILISLLLASLRSGVWHATAGRVNILRLPLLHICLLLGSLLILAGSGAFLLTFRELNNQPSPPAPGIAFLLAAAAILCYTVRRWRQGC